LHWWSPTTIVSCRRAPTPGQRNKVPGRSIGKMFRRTLIAALVVALGALGAAQYASSTFTISRSVMFTPAKMSSDPTPTAELLDVRIECSPFSSHNMSERGDSMMVFNVATPTPEEDPRLLCDDARTERLVTAAAIVLVSLLGAGVLIVTDRARHRRAVELQDSSADVAAPRSTAT
jgi:hypothetical protein